MFLVVFSECPVNNQEQHEYTQRHHKRPREIDKSCGNDKEYEPFLPIQLDFHATKVLKKGDMPIETHHLF